MTKANHDQPGATSLATFNFHGDRLDVATTPDGEHWVALARLCEPLGLDVQGQSRKLLALPWARLEIISTHDASGRDQDIFCLNLRSVAGWLFSVNAGKVRPEFRERLALYQRECADVLADHFMGERTRRATDLPADVLAGLRAIPVLLNRIEALEAGLAARSAATTDKPTVGTGAARMYVLDPLKEIARIEAQAIGSTDARKRKSLRFAAERRLRQELDFPMGSNMRWSNLPSGQLGSACCAVARMHGEAKRFLHVATSRPVKQMLLRLAG